jgi:hypothetical protein
MPRSSASDILLEAARAVFADQRENMSDKPIERIRLPGLFLWTEVCDVFEAESGQDGEWHLEVLRSSNGADDEALYTVYAWRSMSRRGERTTADQAG